MGKWNGSYTIEAVFIVPLCTAVVILLLSKTLFFRDTLVAQRIAQCAAEKGIAYLTQSSSMDKAEIDYYKWKQEGVLRGILDDSSKTDCQTIMNYVNQKMSDELWFADYLGTEISIDESRVTVKITISADRAVAFLEGWGVRWFYQDIKVTEQAKDLPNRNRGIMAAWNTGMKIDGLSDLLTKLQERIGRAVH